MTMKPFTTYYLDGTSGDMTQPRSHATHFETASDNGFTWLKSRASGCFKVVHDGKWLLSVSKAGERIKMEVEP